MIELRYLIRDIPDPADSMLSVRERVLQYRQPEWIGDDKFMGEWEDVPTEIEGQS